MPKNAGILLEGSYLYYEGETNYSQENFKLVEIPELKIFHVYAEILSRMESGEFLKILVHYEMNQNFFPTFVRTERSIGSKYSQEIFKFDLSSSELSYTFQNSQGSQEFKKTFNSKHYLTSPAISTSTLFTISKKFNATGRTPIVLIGSPNDWSYAGPPEEKIIYADFKSGETVDVIINGTALPSNLLRLYENDAGFPGSESPVEFYLSKFHNFPLQMASGSQKIVVKNLKKT